MRTKEQIAFYGTRAWAECRKAYRDSVGGLCEECLKEGKITPGVIVHHKEHISPENIDDPNILLNWNNLQLVCRDCHAKLHPEIKQARVLGEGRKRRYRILPNGKVVTR